MLTRRDAIAALGVAAFAGACAPRAAGSSTGYILSYFAGGKDISPGLRLAMSMGGLRFSPVKGGEIVLKPQVGESKLMRDPFLIKGPAPGDPWHLLWTTAWEGVTLGHATSHDLLHWSPQRAIPVMASVPGTRNVWAPEMIWDARARHFVIFWSSTVTGRFAETAGASESGYNHRLWHVTTRDFVEISEPRLFWDPGFSVIDATFIDRPGLGLHLIVKDETVNPPKKHLRIARAASPTGPFTGLSLPFTPDWVEGPAGITIGEWTYVFYDEYREGKWGAARSRDLKIWEDATPLISVPAGARHGTIVRAPLELIAGLS
ncbi:glycoside hydrolase family 43 protein [Sphingomonas sp.]|jgi:hypothetical protein|uniref:glycoside hydrolase family 43 protein n=1 Tax=Sphingomonas sp. TaxID=28214 RepID=UPI002ED96BCD